MGDPPAYRARGCPHEPPSSCPRVLTTPEGAVIVGNREPRAPLDAGKLELALLASESFPPFSPLLGLVLGRVLRASSGYEGRLVFGWCLLGGGVQGGL